MSGPNFEDFTVVVPVRAGSQRVPGKNLRTFFDSQIDGVHHSLLSWKIDNLSKVLGTRQVLVSSNWEAALEVASELGCRVHRRDEEFCTADAPFDKVIENIARQVTTQHMVWAPVTAPFVSESSIRDFLDTYLELTPEGKRAGLVMASEIRNYFYMSGLPLNFSLGSGHVQTQDIAALTEMAWTFNARPTVSVLEENYMFAENASIYLVDRLTAFDIDNELDFSMAQALVPLFLKRNG
jgi:N-acylneuraminate cytidylyltransferase